MKLLYLALPLLGSLAIAQSLVEDACQCPQVRCPDSLTYLCPRKTTTPVSTLPTPSLPILGIPTPALPTPALPTPVLPQGPQLSDTPRIPGCVCEEMMCIQSYPDSCHCAYGIAKTCWQKCGGPSPGLNTCPPLGSSPFDGPVKRAAAPEPQTTPKESPVPTPVNLPAIVSEVRAPLASGAASPTKKCRCESRKCIQAFPASCVCDNANKHACWKKCGGAKPAFGSCSRPTKPTKPIPTPTPTSDRKVQICGGGRANTNLCPTGYTCINDPYKSGCGLECDGTGICVKEKLCGGFAGFKCDGTGQVCVDDPRDDCSPATGGADCGGLCVWPPALRLN
ncbi:hypothetical protein ST47_g8952 [Ascochyta rabiei]|uniref:Uncharacterized protein n=1 Tax=Didymella rabiei TaxID=5454 RepID=A0A162XSQ1_DIDRA|nr:hypothetical protein ST47_g8952 [Ascochyta rabiei]